MKSIINCSIYNNNNIVGLVLILLGCLVIPQAQSQTTDRHIVPCGVQQRACICRSDAVECEFTLVVSELHTFTSYYIQHGANSNEQKTQPYRFESGSPYFINHTGGLQPSVNDPKSTCFTETEIFLKKNCSIPLTVDGKTYRSSFAVNGLVPGPTLIVSEGQQIIVNVINTLLTEGISIHWHGQDQRNTPWMDGAVGVTQCPINPWETFQYNFTVYPTGTFWYHSHRTIQRIDGLFGALIIRESPERQMLLQRELGVPIIDDPAFFTLNLHEFGEVCPRERFTHILGDLPYYPAKPLRDVPLPGYKMYDSTCGPDGVGIGDIPFWSGLINGKGRHRDVPYENTRLEVFSVSEGNYYRFRLIGGQGLYPYKFSIDEHNLILISADGALLEPIETQFIIIHTGERYDFILNARKPRADIQDYWMRFETLEVDLDSGGPPYRSLGNMAEGILHYTSVPDHPPSSSNYKNIKENSIPFSIKTCQSLGGCTAVNCPFPDFHPSYNTHCINVRDFRLLEPTPPFDLPSGDIDPECNDCEFFFNINDDINALNGHNFRLPSAPLLTQSEDVNSYEFCDVDAPCDKGQCGGECVHVQNINSYKKTIRFVLSQVGPDIDNGGGSYHPVHLHAHHFHVVHIGYGTYDPDNGKFSNRSTDIICDDPLCSKPRWNGTRPTFTVTNRTVTKDTVMVPAGGYAVIHFISDNPGYWYLHCHIEMDLLEGMAVIINEVKERQLPVPREMGICGNVKIPNELSRAHTDKKLMLNHDNSVGPRDDDAI